MIKKFLIYKLKELNSYNSTYYKQKRIETSNK